MAQNSSNEVFDDESSDDAIDLLSDELIQLKICNNPELSLQYKMLLFIYKKTYLKRAHSISVWQEFLLENPDITQTAMELKIEFCLNIMSKIDTFYLLTSGMKVYFKTRIFNQNSDELLLNCDLEPDIDWIDEDKAPVMREVEDPNHWYSKRMRQLKEELGISPINVVENQVKAPPRKSRDLIDLLGIVFRRPDEGNFTRLSHEDVISRMKDEMSKGTNFTQLFDKHMNPKEDAEEEESPEMPIESHVEENPEPVSVMHVSLAPSFRDASFSTPKVSRTASARVSRIEGPRARSQQESLPKFTKRFQARSKPRNLRN